MRITNITKMSQPVVKRVTKKMEMPYPKIGKRVSEMLCLIYDEIYMMALVSSCHYLKFFTLFQT